MNNSRLRLELKGSCLQQEVEAAFTPNNVVNLFIVYGFDTWSKDLNGQFTLKYCLFKNVKTTKNADPDKIFSFRIWNLIPVHLFQIQILIGIKMSLFLELI